jgi:hypothetical protein
MRAVGVFCVRREKARIFSGCNSRPATQRLFGKKTLEIKGNKSVGSLAFDGIRAN